MEDLLLFWYRLAGTEPIPIPWFFLHQQHLLLLLPQYLFPPASSNYSIPSITIKFNIIHQIVPQGISFTLDLSANRHRVADDLSSLFFFCEIINY